MSVSSVVDQAIQRSIRVAVAVTNLESYFLYALYTVYNKLYNLILVVVIVVVVIVIAFIIMYYDHKSYCKLLKK